MDVKTIQLRHKHQMELLELKQKQEVEELQLAQTPAPPPAGRPEGRYVPYKRTVGDRKPVRGPVIQWLQGRPKGSQFTPREIAMALERDPTSISAALVKLGTEGVVRHLQGLPRGQHSFWELI